MKITEAVTKAINAGRDEFWALDYYEATNIGGYMHDSVFAKHREIKDEFLTADCFYHGVRDALAMRGL